MGPFQKIELALWTTLSNNSTVLGPLSKIYQSSGTSLLSKVLVGAVALKDWAQTPSTGKWIFTPLYLALSMILCNVSGSAGMSVRVQPSLCPSNCFKKGLLIPPPIMISSAMFNMLRISSILSVTFEPPRMTSTGFLGLCRNPPRYYNSFCIKRPATLCLYLNPTTLEWALWALPKASFT